MTFQKFIDQGSKYSVEYTYRNGVLTVNVFHDEKSEYDQSFSITEEEALNALEKLGHGVVEEDYLNVSNDELDKFYPLKVWLEDCVTDEVLKDLWAMDTFGMFGKEKKTISVEEEIMAVDNNLRAAQERLKELRMRNYSYYQGVDTILVSNRKLRKEFDGDGKKHLARIYFKVKNGNVDFKKPLWIKQAVIRREYTETKQAA